MSDNDTTLDLNTLNELREMLEEGLDELLAEYLDDTPNQIEQLRSAVNAGDIAAIASVGHALKGSSGNLGVNALYLLCQTLEQEAKGGSVADAAGSLAQIEAAFSRAKEDIAAYRAG